MFNFIDLNSQTRLFMLDAIIDAENSNNIYFSSRFNEKGKKEWIPLIKQAAQEHNEHWLAFQIEANELFKDYEGKNKRFFTYSNEYIPHFAAEIFAEGQFNRFYILGLCKFAKSKGISYLIVYRAKESKNPRDESQSLIDAQLSIDEIESQLKDIQSSFKSKLVQPNSGICMRLP